VIRRSKKEGFVTKHLHKKEYKQMSLHSLKVLYFIYLRSVRLAVIEVSAAHLWE